MPSLTFRRTVLISMMTLIIVSDRAVIARQLFVLVLISSDRKVQAFIFLYWFCQQSVAGPYLYGIENPLSRKTTMAQQ